jgi:hypothetical protein
MHHLTVEKIVRTALAEYQRQEAAPWEPSPEPERNDVSEAIRRCVHEFRETRAAREPREMLGVIPACRTCGQPWQEHATLGNGVTVCMLAVDGVEHQYCSSDVTER